MAFTAKQWQDGVAGGTRLDAAGLIDLEQRLGAYTDSAVAQSVASASSVINAGNLGAAYQLDMAGHREVIVVGTLTANCTITVVNETPGCNYVFELTQDATGGRTVAFPSAIEPSGTITVNPTPLVTTLVTFYYDGTNRIGFSSALGTLDYVKTKRLQAASAGTVAFTGSAISATVVAHPTFPPPNDVWGALRCTMKATGMQPDKLTTVTRATPAIGHTGLVMPIPLNTAAVQAGLYPACWSTGFDMKVTNAPVANSVIDFGYVYVE